ACDALLQPSAYDISGSLISLTKSSIELKHHQTVGNSLLEKSKPSYDISLT
ncbi:hypothetical protein PTT_15133, partial [Pyrenophora teres f. teres 0-1]